jgi:hypothetical protein
MGVFTLFGGITGKDKRLILAEQRAAEIFALDYEDNVEETDGETDGTFSARYLKGLDEESDYILVTRDTGGYIIFNGGDLQPIEFGEEGYSPYKGINNNDIRYAGPAQYYEKEGENFVNANTKQVLVKADAEKIAGGIKERIESAKLPEEKEAGERGKEHEQEETPKIAANFALTAPMSADPGLGGADFKGIDDFPVMAGSRRLIPDYQYFTVSGSVEGYNYTDATAHKYDTVGAYHGVNQYGTCATVAAQLLLGYNNWSKDGRLITNDEFLWGRTEVQRPDIQDKPDRFSNPGFYAGCSSDQQASPTNLANPNHFESVSTSERFYYYLEDMINPVVWPLTSYDERWALLSGIHLGIQTYMSGYVDQTCRQSVSLNHSFVDATARAGIKAEVDAGRPSIVFIDYYDTDNKTNEIEKDMHYVVAYGYQTFIIESTPVEGYIAHFGWRTAETQKAWFNADWVRGYLSFSTSHTHTDVIPDPNNPDWKQCTVCGRVAKYHVHDYKNATPQPLYLPVVSINPSVHAIACNECGALTTRAHYLRQQKAKWVLSEDDMTYYRDPVYHMDVCDCGYEEQVGHNRWRWERHYSGHPLEVSHHLSICACGYETSEIHRSKYGYDHCMFCGFNFTPFYGIPS